MTHPRLCARHCCGQYFSQYLTSVVNNNAEQGYVPDVSEMDILQSEYEHRSRKVAGLFKWFKSRSTPIRPGFWRFHDHVDSRSNSPSRSTLEVTRNARFPNSCPSHTELLRAKYNLLPSFLQQLIPGLLQDLWLIVNEPGASKLPPGDTSDTLPIPRDSITGVPYLTFPAIVGKNSAFHDLTQ